MILFLADQPPQLSPLIQNIIEVKEEAPPPVEYTLEEKIKLNVNKCDTDTQWIRKDNAECKPKKIQKPVKSAVKYVTSDNTAGNTYDYGFCTWYVKSQLSWVNNGWHNAYQWPYYAKQDGFTVSSTPIVGSVAVKGNHVAVVTGISGDQFSLSEMNVAGWNVKSSRTVDISGWQFIH